MRRRPHGRGGFDFLPTISKKNRFLRDRGFLVLLWVAVRAPWFRDAPGFV